MRMVRAVFQYRQPVGIFTSGDAVTLSVCASGPRSDMQICCRDCFRRLLLSPAMRVPQTANKRPAVVSGNKAENSSGNRFCVILDMNNDLAIMA